MYAPSSAFHSIHAHNKVVIVGGGVAGIETILALRDLVGDRVDIYLLEPNDEFVYKPLAVAAPFGLGTPFHFDIELICRSMGVKHHRDKLRRVDAKSRRIYTEGGLTLGYDYLVLTLGATAEKTVEGTVTFSRVGNGGISEVLHGIDDGSVKTTVFAVPIGPTWALPAYELAMLTRRYCRERDLSNRKIIITTPEERPLLIFGVHVSEYIENLLQSDSIELHAGRYPIAFVDGKLGLVPHGTVLADQVIAMPRLSAVHVDGLNTDASGFLPTDEYGRVEGVDNVFAAGDITNFPVKQGGIATQEADAAAAMIASSLGALVTPKAFRPVMKSLLFTDSEPLYLSQPVTGGFGEKSEVIERPLWGPATKIIGKHLTPFLADHPELKKDLDSPLEVST